MTLFSLSMPNCVQTLRISHVNAHLVPKKNLCVPHYIAGILGQMFQRLLDVLGVPFDNVDLIIEGRPDKTEGTFTS